MKKKKLILKKQKMHEVVHEYYTYEMNVLL